MSSPLGIEFESYIVFHRGIKEIYVDDEAKLHAVYQDGYDQILGDPVGDTVRADIVETKANVAHIDEKATETDAKLTEINEKAAEAEQHYNKMVQVSNDFEEYAQNGLPYGSSTEETLQQAVSRIDSGVASLDSAVSDLETDMETKQSKVIYSNDEPVGTFAVGDVWLKPKTTT